MESANATDNCGEVVITVEEITIAGACAGDASSLVRSLLLTTVVMQPALLRRLRLSTR